jgi:hypothetical protein
MTPRKTSTMTPQDFNARQLSTVQFDALGLLSVTVPSQLSGTQGLSLLLPMGEKE